MLRGRWNGGTVASVMFAGVLLLTAGCTGDTAKAPDPATTTSPSSSATPAPTPTPAPAAVDVTVKPQPPAAMAGPPTADGAVAVAEYFLQLYPYVNATGDLTEWLSLSHQDCVFCASVATNTRAAIADGHHDEGGANTIVRGSASEVEAGAWYGVDVDIIQAPSVTVDATGTTVKRFPETIPYSVHLSVVSSGGVWQVREATPKRTSAP